ncbi:MAG: MFS transporter, partial [Ignavibacteriaceae bacterium]
KRFWIIIMQFFIGAGLAGVALTIPVPNFFQYTLAFFWLLAFSSATHDIAADGFYMLGLSKHDQAWFVGIRSTFYRFAFITGQGLLVILAGYIESNSGLPTIDINVYSQPAAQISEIKMPGEINFERTDKNLKILTYPDTLEISTQKRSKKEVDSIISFAKKWNISHNFYKAEKEISNGEELEKPSWWNEYIVQNLELFLRKYFGPTVQIKTKSDQTGNIQIVYFSLSQKPPPNENIVINFGRESGDNSISLVEGTRFEFNQKNWNQTSMAVIQLDPKLRTESSAFFLGRAGNIPLSWMVTFFVLAGLFILFLIYHKFMLPHPKSDVPAVRDGSANLFAEFFRTFALFFKKERIGIILGFILLYRLGEAQLVKLATPFLLDAQEAGGLALTLGQLGFVYGTVGIIFLTLGGILGGFLAAKHGLKHWLWWMIIAINLPDLVYVYLSYTQTTNFLIINAMIAIEQFGYGFGFTAYMLYLIYASDGDHKTSHYAIATGLMALGMMIPGMFSGWLQEIIGYQHFFIWVCLATIPGFIITKFIPLDPEFGKKTEEAKEVNV